jgi:hypothetical protein
MTSRGHGPRSGRSTRVGRTGRTRVTGMSARLRTAARPSLWQEVHERRPDALLTSSTDWAEVDWAEALTGSREHGYPSTFIPA